MSRSALKNKIRQILSNAYPEDTIHVQDGTLNSIYVIMESERFGRKRPRHQADILWSVFFEKLTPDEWGQITLSKIVPPGGIDGVAPKRQKTPKRP